MNRLTPDRFTDFFRELHGYEPYPWQQQLVRQVVGGAWPGAIDLPTGSGKTACLDVAIFALACQASLPLEQRSAPRRLFFCVNRRVIVDEAYARARRIAETLWRTERQPGHERSVLHDVATALRSVGGSMRRYGMPPLDVLELRGGVYRDSRWARSIVQPTVICTTIDQLGSRLLFRGYGVSPNAAPIQAALVAYDSLVLLDEAHISEPFRQTLEYVQRYLDPTRWAEQALGVRPMQLVPMTATPNEAMRTRGVVQLQKEDRATERLDARLSASKPAELVEAHSIVDDAVSAALDFVTDQPAAIGIIVNRVATARAIHERLCELRRPSKGKARLPVDTPIELVIGSMRPIDRDTQAERLRSLVGPERPAVTAKTCFIVSTQCLEVGADYDFDRLVTECASLDALRQRFGRLNRAGRREADGVPVNARAVVLAGKKDVRPEDKLDDARPLDPIYGNALARTWNWLMEHADERIVDFGIDAFECRTGTSGAGEQPGKELLAPSALMDAPVMLPAYVDAWCQTAPKPALDPDVALFIHGSRRNEPDVQVCWREDLIESEAMTRDHWCDVVALLPPTSAECVSLPIGRVRHWLADQLEEALDQGDLLGGEEPEARPSAQKGGRNAVLRQTGVLWRRAGEARLLASPAQLRPGDTLVLPASAANPHALGHFVDADDGVLAVRGAPVDATPAKVHDLAETAFARARDLAVLRLHPALRARLPAGAVFDELFAAAARRDDPPSRNEWSRLLRAAACALEDENDQCHGSLLHLATSGVRIDEYPDDQGVVLTSRRRLNIGHSWFIRPMDEGEDESSRTLREVPVTLPDHSRHVRDSAAEALACLPLEALAEPSRLAALLHDVGKADERFQAMLRRTDRTDAWLLVGTTSDVLAKSDGMPTTPAQRTAARDRAGLPAGFRHEMLSVQLAEQAPSLPRDAATKALILHLIAAHHGYARPFAPIVVDDELPAVTYEDMALTGAQRAVLVPPHRLDSGIAERFWMLTRRFGWWGLAYLEAVLRLADANASAAEDAGEYDDESAHQQAEAVT